VPVDVHIEEDYDVHDTDEIKRLEVRYNELIHLCSANGLDWHVPLNDGNHTTIRRVGEKEVYGNPNWRSQ